MNCAGQPFKHGYRYKTDLRYAYRREPLISGEVYRHLQDDGDTGARRG